MRTTLFRSCGLVIGLLCIGTGGTLLWLYFFGDFEHGLGAFSIVFTGVYLLNFAITGRSTFLKRRRAQEP